MCTYHRCGKRSKRTRGTRNRFLPSMALGISSSGRGSRHLSWQCESSFYLIDTLLYKWPGLARKLQGVIEVSLRLGNSALHHQDKTTVHISLVIARVHLDRLIKIRGCAIEVAQEHTCRASIVVNRGRARSELDGPIVVAGSPAIVLFVITRVAARDEGLLQPRIDLDRSRKFDDCPVTVIPQADEAAVEVSFGAVGIDSQRPFDIGGSPLKITPGDAHGSPIDETAGRARGYCNGLVAIGNGTVKVLPLESGSSSV